MLSSIICHTLKVTNITYIVRLLEVNIPFLAYDSSSGSLSQLFISLPPPGGWEDSKDNSNKHLSLHIQNIYSDAGMSSDYKASPAFFNAVSLI